MLDYKDLQQIMTSEGLIDGAYTLSYLRQIFGASMTKEELIPILECMILATLDKDTFLDELLSVISDFEYNHKIEEENGFHILSIVLSNLKSTKENYIKIIDLIENVDCYDAYNTLFDSFSKFMNEEDKSKYKEKAKKLFVPELLTFI